MLEFSLQKFALKLKIARKSSKLYQWELAEVLGIKRDAYAKYETAACEPTFAFLYSISELYGIPADVFINPEISPDVINEYMS